MAQRRISSVWSRAAVWLTAVSLEAAVLAGPCDIYAAGGTPCVAAHSTVRALYSGYAGMLYQVKRDSDNATKDIPVLAGSGVADSSVQDQFCGVSACVIWRIYDQSPRGNHLHVAPAGTHPPADKPVVATRQRLTVSGHAVYGAVFLGGEGYRNDATSGVAVGDEAQSMYMVVDGTHYNDRCCFDCMSDACFAQLPLHIRIAILAVLCRLLTARHALLGRRQRRDRRYVQRTGYHGGSVFRQCERRSQPRRSRPRTLDHG